MDFISLFFAAVPADACHDAIDDWLRNIGRQFKRTTLGHNLQRLAGRIVKYLAGAAPGEVYFELLAHFWRNVILKIVSKLEEEFVASNHKAILLALAVK